MLYSVKIFTFTTNPIYRKMKKIVFLLSFIAFSHISFSQESYTVNNETLELKTEVDGDLDLLWNTFDGQYRYFIKTESGEITELKNTKGGSNKFQEEYKTTLSDLTQLDASKVKLTTYSLKSFINSYNASKDTNYFYEDSKTKLKTRLGLFGGLTNNPFVLNPNNETVPFLGAELEIFSEKALPKQAGFLNIRYATDNDEFQYSSTQIALGYRFRFVNSEKINVYAQTKFAIFTISKSTIYYQDPNDASVIISEEDSGSALDAPFIFGLGADFKVGNGYITLVYDSIIALFVENQDNFPMDFAIGYKFNL